MLVQLEPRFSRRHTGKGYERFVYLEFGRLHCFPDLLRTKLLFALALDADPVSVWLNDEEIEAALVIALTAQLADLCLGIAALHEVGNDALELLSGQALEGQYWR